MISTAKELNEVKHLLTLEDEELLKAECPFCGKAFSYSMARYTRKEIAEIKVTGGLGANYDEYYIACEKCGERIRDCYAKHQTRFCLRLRVNGDAVCDIDSTEVDDAKQALADKEQEDKDLGIFDQDTYEIFDRYTGKVFIDDGSVTNA